VLHLACWREHGACPVLGCADGCPTRGAGPRPVAWARFVDDAAPWLALGGTLDPDAWGPDALDAGSEDAPPASGSSWAA
jgi:hypothetical protein